MLVHFIHAHIRVRPHTYTSAFSHEGTYTFVRAHPRMRVLTLSCARTHARTRIHMYTTHTGARAQTRMHPGALLLTSLFRPHLPIFLRLSAALGCRTNTAWGLSQGCRVSMHACTLCGRMLACDCVHVRIAGACACVHVRVCLRVCVRMHACSCTGACVRA